MKTPATAALLTLGLVSCGGESPRALSESAPQQKRSDTVKKIPYTVVSTYIQGGRAWRLLTVQQMLSDEDLIVLAKQLHRTYGGDSIDIFDDDSEVGAYEKWAKGMPGVGRSPYPAQWVKKHHIGMINKMLSSRGMTWQLFGGAAHPTRPESFIADLG